MGASNLSASRDQAASRASFSHDPIVTDGHCITGLWLCKGKKMTALFVPVAFVQSTHVKLRSSILVPFSFSFKRDHSRDTNSRHRAVSREKGSLCSA